MTVPTDSNPYLALPKLYGAPAYARPPRVVAEIERPLDPDDLPIVAEMTDDERSYAASVLQVPAIDRPIDGAGSPGGIGEGGRPSAGGNGPHPSARRLSLRALSERLGPRPK